MKVLFILNDPPYGTERSYNGLRLAKGILESTPESELANLTLEAERVLVF
jgi:uncharacterized protein involved in oxidation of intracellular sulfur